MTSVLTRAVALLSRAKEYQAIISQSLSKLRNLMPTWIAQWMRDTRLLLGSQLVAVLATTALAIILARSLGPSDWGLFSALLGVSLGLSTFVDVGLGTWLLRELSRLREDEAAPERFRRESSRRVIGGAVANFGFGVALFAGSVVVLLSLGTGAESAVALLGLISYTVFISASSCLEALLRAQRSLKLVVAATQLEKLVLLGLVGLVVLADAGIAAVGLAYLVAGIARLSFSAVTIFAIKRVPVVVPAFGHVRRFVRSGVPFAFNTVALNVIPRFDTLLVAVVSATAAGYFALGDRVIGPMLMVPAVATSTLYPFLARERQASTAAWRISAGMVGLGMAAAVLGALLAPIVVPLVFGSSYDDAVPVVQLMLFAVPFIYGSGPLLAHLYTIGQERRLFAATVFASLLGTAAVIGGAVLLDAPGAAAGYVVRYALFALVLGGLAIWHRGGATAAVSFDAHASPLTGDSGSE